MQKSTTIGILLFLFIPLVLYLFLRFPFGIPISFLIAIVIMFGHRLIARPFFLSHRSERCFWCGKSGRSRSELNVDSINIQACRESCAEKTKRFLAFCRNNRIWIGAGIFLPLIWYVVTMLLVSFGMFTFPVEWNRFIFQFVISCTVVTISFAYRRSMPAENIGFPFPLHNLFLLGAKNILLVFRYVGIWWIFTSLFFLLNRYRGSM